MDGAFLPEHAGDSCPIDAGETCIRRYGSEIRRTFLVDCFIDDACRRFRHVGRGGWFFLRLAAAARRTVRSSQGPVDGGIASSLCSYGLRRGTSGEISGDRAAYAPLSRSTPGADN